MRKYLLSLFISVFTMCAALAQVAGAQSHITGKVIDTITHESMVGATVMVKGTSVATQVSLDGSFKLNVPEGSHTLVVSFVGYVPRTITFGDGNQNLGTIFLNPNSSNMKEVVITGDIAIDRKTPVAVTTIGPEFIEEHIGNGDIPDLLIGVPGVFATDGDGGYGDQRISIRGFSSRSGNGNVAYTVNGIPVNDPETGALYWSDFSGITDVTRSIQVQRGIGANKIIVPAFGGTVNVTTRTTDQQAGGFVSEGIGSDGYNKTAVMVSTGLTAGGWAATFAGSRTEGAFPFDGSNFKGYDYFFNLSKILSPSQTIALTLIGTNQSHGQRPEENLVPYVSGGKNYPGYLGAPQDVAWNSYYGYKDGQTYNPYNNFYSEPILSINHEWTISSRSSLSTVLYGLLGSGGGGGLMYPSGSGVNAFARSGGEYTPINYTAIETANAANANGASTTYAYDSHSQTDWAGLRSTYRTTFGKYLDLEAGVDLRYYVGNHYDRVDDLLGGSFVAYNRSGSTAKGTGVGDINNPIDNVGVNGKIDYYNRDYVESGGAFAQAEYSKNNFTAFVTLSGSEDADARRDYFNYLDNDPAQKSRWVNFTTYQAKGGANYNINSQMNVYANVGYLTKPPYFAGVFVDYTNQINNKAITEKLFDYELGYNYKISTLSLKLDAYRTSYKDRALASTVTDSQTGDISTINVSGVNAIYQGVELELNYKPVQQVLVGGMVTVEDNYYTANAGPASLVNSAGQVVATQSVIDLKNEKIGDTPQDMFQAFAEVKLVPQLKVGISCNYYWNYTSYVPFTNYTSPNQHPYIVPNYALWKMNAAYKFKMGGFDAQLIGTVNNLLNSKVITDAEDYAGTGSTANGNILVDYMLQRTFTTTLKIRF
ncbi:TonB-dependent receptor [Mucilaginibacter sp.]